MSLFIAVRVCRLRALVTTFPEEWSSLI